jgi:hypothetical protein
MGLNEYLFKSNKHQDLLRILFVEDQELTAYSLAQLTELPYATTHAELEKLAAQGLLQARKEGRHVLFKNAAPESTRQLFAELLGASRRSTVAITDSAVKASLQDFGAPLVVEDTPAKSYPDLEEVLVRGVLLAKKDPSIARAIPVAIHKNAERLDSRRLLVLARKHQAKQELGFFLALTSELSGEKSFAKLARALKDRRLKDDRDFFENQGASEYQRRLTERNTPTLAKKWKFRMNMSFETFQSTFQRFSRRVG